MIINDTYINEANIFSIDVRYIVEQTSTLLTDSENAFLLDNSNKSLRILKCGKYINFRELRIDDYYRDFSDTMQSSTERLVMENRGRALDHYMIRKLKRYVVVNDFNTDAAVIRRMEKDLELYDSERNEILTKNKQIEIISYYQSNITVTVESQSGKIFKHTLESFSFYLDLDEDPTVAINKAIEFRNKIKTEIPQKLELYRNTYYPKKSRSDVILS